MGRRYGLGLAIAAWLAALACAPPPVEEASPPAGGPLERPEYARRLAAAAGGPVAVERLVELAGAAAARIEARMDRLAVALGEPTGGRRPVLERLLLERYPDEGAVLGAYRDELARAAEFIRARSLVALPAAEPEVVILENSSLRALFPLALYHDGRFAVTTRPAEGNDPAYLANHCRVCIPPLAVHEGYPGHHVAFSRMADAAGERPSVAELARYKPFVEGWALYAEVLMLEEGYYAEPERRLAAWRMVLLRLVRAEIDARLHGGGLPPAAAAGIYEERLLMTPAAAAAEVRAHLAKPTVKASYFLGLLQILELRAAWRADHPERPARELHDRLLGPPATVPDIARERFGVELGTPDGTGLPWPWAPG